MSLDDMVSYDDGIDFSLLDNDPAPTDPIEPDPVDPQDPTDPQDPEPVDPITDPEPSDPEPEPTDPEPTEPTEPVEPIDTEDLNKYYEFLNEAGILKPSENFKFDGTAESLETAFAETKGNLQREAAMSIWDSLPDEYKPILQYAFSGGKNVEQFLNTYKNGNIDYENLDLEDVDNQKEVLYQVYKNTTNFSDDKIEKLISALEKQGSLEEEAVAGVVELRSVQEKMREELQEQARLQQVANLEKEKENRILLSSKIKESPLSSERKSRLETFLFTNTKEGDNKMDATINSIVQNKDHLIQLADLLLDYDPKTGFQIADRFSKIGKTNAINEFQNKLQEKFVAKSKSKGPVKNDTNIDWNLIFGSE